MAKDLSCSVTDLIALAPQNDPFYVGTPADVASARWFAEIWLRGAFRQGAHLRRIHYWCTSQVGLALPNGKAYENTLECWQALNKASKAARYLGLVAISDFADHKNPDPHLHATYSNEAVSFEVDAPSLSDPYIRVEGFNACDYQPYHLELFVEKSTMNDVLIPVCRRYHTNLVTGEGEMSITSVYTLVNRIKAASKPARVFYISDFDPAGKSMPRSVARKLEWMMQEQGLNDADVKLHPLC